MSFDWGLFSEKALDSIDNSDARLNIWHGSVRSGKTISSLVRWLQFISDAPPGNLLMVGKTERTLRDNILSPLSEMIPRKHYRHNVGTGEVTICGRRILLRGAPDEQAKTKIQGLTLAGAYGDELTIWPESFYKMLLSRLSVSGAKFFGTTNPDSPYHWLKRDYLDREDALNLKHWQFGIQDNLTLDPGYVEDLSHEYTGLWFERYFLGRWILAEGAIYDQWDEAVHVVDEMPGIPEKVVIGIDYGTSNATVFLALGKVRGAWYTFDEYYHSGRESGRQKTDAEYARDFKEWLDRLGCIPSAVLIDPSAASFKAQLRKDGVRKLQDADNSVVDGIRNVATGLTTNRLKVLKKCKELRSEIPGYVWDKKKAEEQGKEEPMKGVGIRNHALDAWRYSCRYIFGPQIQRALRVVR